MTDIVTTPTDSGKREDPFVERCQLAITDLELLVGATAAGRERSRLLGKAEGLRLALSYLRDYPTAEAALLAEIQEAVAEAEGFDERDELTAAKVRHLLAGWVGR